LGLIEGVADGYRVSQNYFLAGIPIDLQTQMDCNCWIFLTPVLHVDFAHKCGTFYCRTIAWLGEEFALSSQNFAGCFNNTAKLWQHLD
jgi:hypothetical protein